MTTYTLSISTDGEQWDTICTGNLESCIVSAIQYIKHGYAIQVVKDGEAK